jgi:transcriptional regulator with XRE-family HTH domain
MPSTAISHWTGHEARLLRHAMRLSVRAFAGFLGVSPRAVSKWEAAGAGIVPRPDTQAILDTALGRAAPEVHLRFERSLAQPPSSPALVLAAGGTAPGSPGTEVPPPLIHPVDGKRMVLVPWPARGSDSPEGARGAFWIDTIPVTNAEYHRFVTDTGHRGPAHWLEQSLPPELHDHPVVHVTHADAATYAAWAGKRLPSVREWEAAVSGRHGGAFPWGATGTAMKCNVRESGIGHTTAVLTYHSGISDHGVHDLAGNVWEWCRTETAPERYALKGSAFTSPLAMAAGSQTNDAHVSMQDDDTGFRCVVEGEALPAPARSPGESDPEGPSSGSTP